MTNRVLGKVLACLLTVLMPAATLSAETHAAMLYSANSVLLNGVGAGRSSAVFAGDTIQTPADSAVTLTAQGSTVMLSPSSLLVYQDNEVRLASGATLVTTEKRMKTQVQTLLVTPVADRRSSYRVERGNGKVMIAALRGAVTVSDGSSERLIAEGSATTVADPDPLPQAQPAGGGGTAGGLSTKTAIVAGIAVVGAAALIAIETGKNPVTAP